MRAAAYLVLASWLAGGAMVASAAERALGNSHWGFTPPVRAPLPDVQNSTWTRSAIDRFILAALEKQQLVPARSASRRTLIRRLSFALTGLPPTPDEVEKFLADPSPNAYDQLVERLLGSPHYGERWGRHWLDIAGYADSNGYFHADTDRPLAYHYRDYVVRSLNADKPLDQFVREQVAGDELAGFDPQGDVTPDMFDPLVATHFLRNGPDGTGESDGNLQEQTADRYAVLESAVQIISSTFLGLTVQCARCHDHKFEPISQREYYQLQAILRPAYDPANWRKPNERVVTLGLVREKAERRKQIERHTAEVKALRESLESLTKPFQRLISDANLDTLPQELRTEINTARQRPERERSAVQKALLKKHDALLNPSADEVVKKYRELEPAWQALKQSLAAKEKTKPENLPGIAVLSEIPGKAPQHHILRRGQYMQPDAPVVAGVPAVLSRSGHSFAPGQPLSGGSGNRTALANWLTSPEHPTVARLLVDRVWRAHFGRGLLPVPGNLGLTGRKATHPELLDYLAVELIQSGWRLKHLQRLIVRSALYQQASEPSSAAPAVDPDNMYYGHFPVRRLDAEAIRDAMLAVSGELDVSFHGPFVRAKANADGEVVVAENDRGARRRSIYLQQRRTQPVAMLDVFDGARMDPNCVARTTSTVALQSLALLNSDFVRRCSRSFARHLARTGTSSVERVFALALGRPPLEAERQAAEDFLRTQGKHYEGKADVSERVWGDFCQMLLASDMFLYVD